MKYFILRKRNEQHVVTVHLMYTAYFRPCIPYTGLISLQINHFSVILIAPSQIVRCDYKAYLPIIRYAYKWG